MQGSQELFIMAGRHCSTGTWLAQSKKKCFSIALRHTLVVLEMH